MTTNTILEPVEPQNSTGSLFKTNLSDPFYILEGSYNNQRIGSLMYNVGDKKENIELINKELDSKTYLNDIKKGDKIYLAPGYKLPYYRISAYIKEKGARIVREINKANKIYINKNSFISRIENKSPYGIYTNNAYMELDSELKLAKVTNKPVVHKLPKHRLMADWRFFYNIDTTLRDYITFPNFLFLDENSIKIMDKCNTNIEFITESSIVDESSSNLELDADLFNALIENLNSKDSQTLRTTLEIIANLPIKSSIPFLLKLMLPDLYLTDVDSKTKKMYRVANERIQLGGKKWKNIRGFLENTKFIETSNYDHRQNKLPTSLIQFLNENEGLTLENLSPVYQKIKSNVEDYIKHNCLEELFEIKITEKDFISNL